MDQAQTQRRTASNIFWRALMSLAGIAILSLGTAFLRGGQVGLDPFTATNMGASHLLGMSLGVYQLIANFVIFIFVLLTDRSKIGLGTIFNMVLVGFEIQWFSAWYKSIFGSAVNPLIITADLIIGLLLFTLGASMYMGADLGVAPYDAIAPILSNKFHTQYRTMRIAQDVLFMILGFFLRGPVSYGTIIVAFFTGPLITFWDRHVSQPMSRVINKTQNYSPAKTVGYMLSNFGKSSYGLVSRSYEMTNLMQRRLSQYSPKDIEDQIKVTRRNMEIARASYQGSERRYNMLREELQRRKKIAAANGEKVDRSSEKF